MIKELYFESTCSLNSVQLRKPLRVVISPNVCRHRWQSGHDDNSQFSLLVLYKQQVITHKTMMAYCIGAYSLYLTGPRKVQIGADRFIKNNI